MGREAAQDQDEFLDDIENLDDNDSLDGGDDEDRGDIVDNADDDGDGDSGRSPFVPHARFHEVNEKAKQLEAEKELERQERERLAMENEQLRRALANGGQPPKQDPPEPTIDEQLETLIDQHSNLMYSGEEAEAKNVMKRILELNQQKAIQAMEEQTAARMEQADWQRTCIEIVTKYPVLSDNKDEQDPAVLADVQEWTRFYQSPSGGGLSRVDAVQKAADRICKPLYPDADDRREKRQQPNLQQTKARNAQDSTRIPPTARAGIGERGKGTKLDIEDLSDDELKNLPESEKAKLRGDFI